MIEMPNLNGRSLGKPHVDDVATEYCDIVHQIFFAPYGPSNESEPFEATVPIGFLLFTNAHPEMRAFMSQPDAWDFLNSITGQNLYIFSSRLAEGQRSLNDDQERAILDVFDFFGLGDTPLNPHLVLCDFAMSYTKGGAPYEHIYNARIGEFVSFAIENRPAKDYVDAFRNSLGKALKRPPASSESNTPSREIGRAIMKAQLVETFRKAIEGLFKDDFSKKFAAAWTLLTWRPKTIR